MISNAFSLMISATATNPIILSSIKIATTVLPSDSNSNFLIQDDLKLW